MTGSDPLAAVEAAAKDRARRRVRLAPYCSWRVGGPADLFVEPETPEEAAAVLRAAVQGGVPVFLLGGGTNLLVRDGGIRGVVLRLGKGFRKVEVNGDRVIAGAAAPLARAAAAAERAALAGLEFAFDIPGTVGGALAINAGAHGGEIGRVLEEVDVLDEQGNRVRIAAGEVRFAYRSAVFPVERPLFLRATFRLVPASAEAVAVTRRRNHARRLATQPKGHSAGSVFRNPEGDSAGRLIEAAGLKGTRIGGAVVSPVHANWILNEGGATSADIETLLGRVQQRVREAFGVELQPEVRIVGEPEPQEVTR